MQSTLSETKIKEYSIQVLEHHDDHDQIYMHPDGVAAESAVDEVIDCLYRVNQPYYWKKLLKESDIPQIYNECLKHVDSRFCFIIVVKLFKMETNLDKPGTKAEAVINRIRRRKYLHSLIKALDAVLYYCIAEDVAVGDLKRLIHKRLDTMDNAVDFILD